ncbi:MAG: TetR/AcrR family transcriptional regulator, partial [Kangiella sp.]|nr:TetR/AcrR family transcriptional regulator [Kangiella sp.]
MNAFQDRIDGTMLAEADALTADGDDGGAIRDRLFDLMMARFDALAPYRPAMAEITKDALRDPGSARFLPRMARSMSRILEAAGVGATGLSGAVRAKGLALVYAEAFRVWLGDETADQSKTMAALDRGLARAEKAQRFLARACTRRMPRNAAPEAGVAAADTPG